MQFCRAKTMDFQYPFGFQAYFEYFANRKAPCLSMPKGLPNGLEKENRARKSGAASPNMKGKMKKKLSLSNLFA